MVGAGVEEVDEAGAAVELGEEDGGVSLWVGILDPLKTGPYGAVLAAPFAQHPAPITAHTHGLKLLLNILKSDEKKLYLQEWEKQGFAKELRVEDEGFCKEVGAQRFPIGLVVWFFVFFFFSLFGKVDVL